MNWAIETKDLGKRYREVRAVDRLDLRVREGGTVFMSSHILAEVSLLADRIGIIHQGHLLQELSVEELERNRQRRLLLRTCEPHVTHQALLAAGQSAKILPDGAIELSDPDAIERPEVINCLLVDSGTPPMQLMVEEEGLEQYFLRLVGVEKGLPGEESERSVWLLRQLGARLTVTAGGSHADSDDGELDHIGWVGRILPFCSAFALCPWEKSA
jgi:ABC-type multidrug transport system ATPase subunit